jgi:glutathione synthase/RimK-type ligase-like ATP-grasp enzyme
VYRYGLDYIPPTHELYTEYVPNTREYRVHVYRDRAIRIQGKYLDYPEQNTNPYIKNHAQGYRFRTPRLQLRPNRVEDAIRAVHSVGLVYGAVDLIVTAEGEHKILEVNSAPAMSPLTLKAYAEAIAEELELDVNYRYLDSLQSRGSGYDG